MPAEGIDPSWLGRPLDDLGLPSSSGVRALRLETADGWRWRSVDAAFLTKIFNALGIDPRGVALFGLPADLQKLLMLAHAPPALSSAAPAPAAGFVPGVGLRAAFHAREVGTFLALLGEVVRLLPRFVMGRARVRRADFVEVLSESSSGALAIVAVVNVLMGAILAFVGAVQLSRFGAGIYVANLVGIASVRELTPIITGIVLAGRTGASFAARIGTMQGNEEIDALTTLGVSPAEFLVVPRVAALTVLMPLLYVYGCAFAILGGLAVSVPLLDLSAAAWASQLHDAVGAPNFAIGGLKAAVFGAVVALVGCHYGLDAERSAAGVGFATTSAVVTSIVGIIALDAVFAVCANALHV
jgi:phospholipid/cholesterol/gamma-HCH transport system permease protein